MMKVKLMETWYMECKWIYMTLEFQEAKRKSTLYFIVFINAVIVKLKYHLGYAQRHSLSSFF